MLIDYVNVCHLPFCNEFLQSLMGARVGWWAGILFVRWVLGVLVNGLFSCGTGFLDGCPLARIFVCQLVGDIDWLGGLCICG